MKSVILLFTLIISSTAEEVPTLDFKDEISWKQIFDSGFRPKFKTYSRHNSCVSENQSFRLKFKEQKSDFKLEKGRLEIIYSERENQIRMIWHQDYEPITLEEGRHRVDRFRELFNGYITQEITMPAIIDPSGLVDAGNEENDIKARVGKYFIIYGFNNSFGTTKPILPHFYIFLRYPEGGDIPAIPITDTIKPPAGYEWYSLDPKVNTPDPGETIKPIAVPEAQTTKKPEPVREVSEERKKPVPKLPEVTSAPPEKTSWQWVAALIALIAGMGFFLKRRSMHG